MGEIYKFNKEKEFEKDCKPILDKLRLICSLYDIPFFWTACVKNDEKGSVYQNEIVGNLSRGINLKDDQISKHISVCMGFDTVPKKNNFEVDLEQSNIKDPNKKEEPQ